MKRGDILKAGIEATMKHRQEQHGDPYPNLRATAILWTSYLSAIGGLDVDLSTGDVAKMMVLFKMARSMHGYLPDNYIDGAAWFAIAGECEQLDLFPPSPLGEYEDEPSFPVPL